MKLSVREMQLNDIEKIVDYFFLADIEFLKAMGADKSKLPDRKEWIQRLESELQKPYSTKALYYIIWVLDNQAIGHSNINTIELGESAIMHLHLWKNEKRRSGLGLRFLKLTIPYYFKNFGIKKLICEPYSKNAAPNRALIKFGFKLVRTYATKPGFINFHQIVNRYELKKEQLSDIKIIKATINDTKTVADLVAKLLVDFNNKNSSNFIVDKTKLEKTTRHLIKRSNYGAFIAYDSKNNPKGLITVSEASAIYNGGDFGVITEFYVDRNSRSNGIGKLLLDHVFDFSESMSWKKIEVGAPNAEQWPRTITFYERNGFKQKGPKLRIDLNNRS